VAKRLSNKEWESRLGSIVSSLTSEWAARDREVKRFRELRYMEHEIKVPVDMEPEKVKLPTGYQIIERMLGTLATNAPSITCPPADKTQRQKELSSKREHFTAVLLEQLWKQSGEDSFERFLECLLSDGHGCLRVLYAPQVWADYPTRRGEDDPEGEEKEEDFIERTERWKRGKPVPIAVNWVDPLNVFPVFGEFGLEMVMERDTRNLVDLNTDKWNGRVPEPMLWELSKTAGSPGKVTFTQIWTRKELLYFVEGRLVHREENAYGAPPYIYAMGFTNASRETDKMAVSALYPLKDIIPAYDRAVSQKATAVRMWCWPTPVYTQSEATVTHDKDGNPILRELELVPGKTATIMDGERLGFLTWEGNGPDADELLRIYDVATDRAGLSSTLYGMSGGESGYAIAQLINAARMKFKPIILHAERAYELLIQRIWDIIEYQIGEPVYVFDAGKRKQWLELGPKDLEGYRHVIVQLNPVLPTDEYARSSKTINEVTNGLISMRRAREQIGVEQPEEEDEQIRVEKWMSNPTVEQFLTQEALKAAQLQLTEEMIAETVGQQIQALPPALRIALLQQLLGEMQGTGVAAPQGMPGMGSMPGMGRPAMMPSQAQQAGPFAGMPAPMPGPPVYAAPNVRANPNAPPPQRRPGPRPKARRVGRRTRPSGIATGRAPGVKRPAQER